MSASSRNRTTKSSGKSSTARGERMRDVTTMPSVKDLKLFDSSAATASMFLYAQGRSVICCHHDTLNIERRFSKHSEEVQLLAVDNQSEAGGGRLVVSYDAGQTAIVWDLMTGDEVARFASFETLTTAAWMHNGNVAFGNTQGNIILFEPTISEHISLRTIDQIAVTALAPLFDCRTFAIGYQNGSLLIATLQPRFTILHNLTTSRAPSPIVTLAWHGSSSRQKSDMLAVQKHDGDLRVWSVAKNYNAEDPAKVVRILRRRESFASGPNWMGWSKNGRIIQFSDTETISWDVRTKHVTFDSIPTLEQVKGLALYGPGASLFTLGPNGTVQQFDLNSPSIMVANVQHPTTHLPPSPPNSIEEPGAKSAHSATTIHTSESESSSVPLDIGVSESDEDHMSPFARFSRQPHLNASGNDALCDTASPVSSRSALSSQSMSSAGSRTPGYPHGSTRSRGLSDNTYISAGSSVRPSTVGWKEQDGYSMGYAISSTSGPSLASSRSRHRPSRLRNEVPRSPDDSKVHDLFKFTRTRLSDLPYKHPMRADNTRLTNDDLRRQMLSTIFGWHGSVEDLIRDEMCRHTAGSASRILLAKWLGEMDSDIMAGRSENMSSSDWMLLALSGIGGHQSQHKLGRAYVQRLLESGDIHVAVTIMLGMGDTNDAIEVYISHKRYMEALILTCIAFPGVWERQAAIIRKWGEWAVQHGQQQLAIRCFACTDQEPTEPWRSPSAVQLNFQSMTPNIPEVLSPPLSPPGIQRGPQRDIAKTSALKIITSFGNQMQKSKFYSQGDGGQTPVAAGVTPIAESAISPAGNDAATAFIRPSSNSRFNTPTSARRGGSSYGRGRLPSIGEVPSDLNRESLRASEMATGQNQMDIRRDTMRMSSAEQDNLAAGISLKRASTASPMMMRAGFQKLVKGHGGERASSPNQAVVNVRSELKSNIRNTSRDRFPLGDKLQLKPVEQTTVADTMSPQQSGSSSNRFHWPSRRRGPGSIASSITSTSSAGRNLRTSQKHRDDYIHSLEAAQHYSRRNGSRGASTERTREPSQTRQSSRERRKTKSREASEERGRASARSWTRSKRSPTSPIPMSPEDIANLSTPKYFRVGEQSATARKMSGHRGKATSRTSSRGSHRRSPDGRPRIPTLDTGSKDRSVSRKASRPRSPSSPVPLSATAAAHYQGSEDEEDFKKALQEQEKFRSKHSRSTSRNNVRSPIAGNADSLDHHRGEVNDSLDGPPNTSSLAQAASTEHAGDLRQLKGERQKKKDLAAHELEARRKSLGHWPQALQIQIPPPNDDSNVVMRIGVEMAGPKESEEGNGVAKMHQRSSTAPPRTMYARSGSSFGLPATPKAMKLIMEAEKSSKLDGEAPSCPHIPADHHDDIMPGNSLQKADSCSDLLTLLPSTVYQPPPRLPIPRCMSAPIPDEPSHTRSSGRSNTRETGNIGERANSRQGRSQDKSVMPPSVPAPPALPMLKELAHLAIPPPPPPAPLPNAHRPHNSGGGGGALENGLIEIVMDEDDDAPIRAAPNDGMVPVLAPPAPPSRGRNRGRSVGEGSISIQQSRAGERIRSASRTRRDTSAISMTKRLPLKLPSDGGYHSANLPMSPAAGVPPPVMWDPDVSRHPIESMGKHMSTGLHRNELI